MKKEYKKEQADTTVTVATTASPTVVGQQAEQRLFSPAAGTMARSPATTLQQAAGAPTASSIAAAPASTRYEWRNSGETDLAASCAGEATAAAAAAVVTAVEDCDEDGGVVFFPAGSLAGRRRGSSNRRYA